MRSSFSALLCLVLAFTACPGPADPGNSTSATDPSATHGTSSTSSTSSTDSGQVTSSSTASGPNETSTTTTEALTGEPVDTTTTGSTTTDTATTGTSTSESTTGDACLEDKCIVGLGESELIDPDPVHDFGLMAAGRIVVGGDEGLRVWKLDGDAFSLHATIPTPSPVLALVTGPLALIDPERGVAAICPEAGEMLIFKEIAGELSPITSVPIPVGSVDIDFASLMGDTVGDLLVLDRAQARLLPFAHDGAGNFAPQPPIALQGQPVAVSSAGLPLNDNFLAAVAEPEGSAVMIVERADLLAAELDVVPVPAGPGDLRFSSFSDDLGPQVVVASEVGAQVSMVTRSGDSWMVSSVPFDSPAGLAVGPLHEPFGVLALLHRSAGQVSIAPFTNGVSSALQPPMWLASTIDDPQRILVRGRADVLVSSPTAGLAIHRAIIL